MKPVEFPGVNVVFAKDPTGIYAVTCNENPQ